MFVLFLALLGLYCCIGFSLVAVREGYSLDLVFRLLIEVASLVSEHRLSVAGASRVAVHRLRGCGMQT